MIAGASIGFKVAWIARMMRTRFDARARTLELTRAQWMMMFTIQSCEGATQSELASKLEVNTVTAARVIDRLEAASLCERRPDPIDRRVNRLYLTVDARTVLAQLSQIGAEEERVSLIGLSGEEHTLLLDLLDRVIDNLKTQPAPSPPSDEDELAIGMLVDER